MEILAEDGMLDENGQIRKDRELSEDSKMYSLFMDTYRFACERFGEQNVVGAYIHLDEYTPHMHVFVVPITMKESRYGGKVRTDEAGNPIMKGVLDAKNIFSPVTIKQLWADYAKCLEEYGVSKAEGKVPKGMYSEVATMDAVIEQKQTEIEVLSDMMLKGQECFKEVERRMSAVSGSLDVLECVIRGHEKHNVGTPVYSDPMCQEVLAATLFPTLADWDIVKRVDGNTLILQNSRTFGAAQIRFEVGGPYVRMYENTNEVGQDGRYVYRWTKEQRYDYYIYSHPREFEDLGRAGVADTYVQHLMQFSLRLRSYHTFEDVMRAATSVSPSVRYYLLTEYCSRNAGNVPQNVKDQCSAVKKELKDVIMFPKEAKGQSQVIHR